MGEQKLPIDKEYLISSLINFDKEILSKKYANGVTYTPTIGNVTSEETPDVSVDINLNTNTAEFSFVLPKGDKGDTPYIGENGNWWYGDTDSGVPIPSFLDLLKYVDKEYGIQDTPIGHILTHMGTIAPNHYLVCDGSEYQISDYPYLTQHIIDNFGSVNFFGGDGETTFAVPNLQGEFLRGTGVNSHTNQGSGSSVGVHQDATKHVYLFRYDTGNIIIGGQDGVSATLCDYIDYASNRKDTVPSKASVVNQSFGKYYTSRPTNTSVLYCIKYEPTYFLQIVNPE